MHPIAKTILINKWFILKKIYAISRKFAEKVCKNKTKCRLKVCIHQTRNLQLSYLTYKHTKKSRSIKRSSANSFILKSGADFNFLIGKNEKHSILWFLWNNFLILWIGIVCGHRLNQRFNFKLENSVGIGRLNFSRI